MDITVLESFGFSENEGRVYITLLEFGALSPYSLAERTGLNRSYLYDILNRMMEKGYLTHVKIKGSAHFQAVAPRQLHALFTLKAKEFERVLPELEEIKRPVESTTTEMHKGRDVHATLMKDILRTIGHNEQILGIVADEQQFAKQHPVLLKQYFRQLEERHAKERVLVKSGGGLYGPTHVAYREIPHALIGNTSTFIYGNRVAEVILGTPNYMIITENAEMAATKRKLFEHLWGEADEIQR